MKTIQKKSSGFLFRFIVSFFTLSTSLFSPLTHPLLSPPRMVHKYLPHFFLGFLTGKTIIYININNYNNLIIIFILENDNHEKRERASEVVCMCMYMCMYVCVCVCVVCVCVCVCMCVCVCVNLFSMANLIIIIILILIFSFINSLYLSFVLFSKYTTPSPTTPPTHSLTNF